MTKTRQAWLNEAEPWARLALAILERARDDAAAGDLAALGWLAGPGYQLAEMLDPRGGGALALVRWSWALLEKQDAARAAHDRPARRGYWPNLAQQEGAEHDTENPL